MHWMAEGDPVKLRAVSEMAIVEFFLLLDKKIAETKKHMAQARKRAAK